MSIRIDNWSPQLNHFYELIYHFDIRANLLVNISTSNEVSIHIAQMMYPKLSKHNPFLLRVWCIVLGLSNWALILGLPLFSSV